MKIDNNADKNQFLSAEARIQTSPWNEGFEP